MLHQIRRAPGKERRFNVGPSSVIHHEMGMKDTDEAARVRVWHCCPSCCAYASSVCVFLSNWRDLTFFNMSSDLPPTACSSPTLHVQLVSHLPPCSLQPHQTLFLRSELALKQGSWLIYLHIAMPVKRVQVKAKMFPLIKIVSAEREDVQTPRLSKYLILIEGKRQVASKALHSYSSNWVAMETARSEVVRPFYFGSHHQHCLLNDRISARHPISLIPRMSLCLSAAALLRPQQHVNWSDLTQLSKFTRLIT